MTALAKAQKIERLQRYKKHMCLLTAPMHLAAGPGQSLVSLADR